MNNFVAGISTPDGHMHMCDSKPSAPFWGMKTHTAKNGEMWNEHALLLNFRENDTVEGPLSDKIKKQVFVCDSIPFKFDEEKLRIVVSPSDSECLTEVNELFDKFLQLTDPFYMPVDPVNGNVTFVAARNFLAVSMKPINKPIPIPSGIDGFAPSVIPATRGQAEVVAIRVDETANATTTTKVLSSLIQRSILDEVNCENKLMDFARVFLEKQDVNSWPEFTQDAKDALRGFWTSRDRNSEGFVLTFLAINPIVFPEHHSEFCDNVESAMVIVNRIEHREYRRLARGILVDRCPQFAWFGERAANLLVFPTRYIRLDVPRERLLEHAVEWFEARTGEEIRESHVAIYFQHEYGSDAGGLGREWFHLLGQAIADEANGILVATESRRLAPSAVGDISMEFVGKFVAKSIIALHRPIREIPP
jgi:hypothetical protein